MNYYRMKEETGLDNIITPCFPFASRIWSEETPLLLPGNVRNPEAYLEFLPFYQATVMAKAFLVSSQVWRIWSEFQKGGRRRPCAFGHIKKRQIRPYSLVMPRILEALGDGTKFLRDGTIQTVCLSKEAVGANRVFAVKGGVQLDVMVAEDVLEEMLRQGITGFRYELAEMRGD